LNVKGKENRRNACVGAVRRSKKKRKAVEIVYLRGTRKKKNPRKRRKTRELEQRSRAGRISSRSEKFFQRVWGQNKPSIRTPSGVGGGRKEGRGALWGNKTIESEDSPSEGSGNAQY